MLGIRESIVEIVKNGPLSDCHSGLWLDRYLPKSSEEISAQAKAEHLQSALRIGLPRGYDNFINSRETHFFGLLDTQVLVAKCTARLIVGLGRATPWENGIQIHHTWGVPMIPGSSFKGLAAAFAHRHLDDEHWRRRMPGDSSGGGDSHNILFGNNDEQGCVTFHDGLWIPASGKSESKLGLNMDTITVHHQDYYSGKDNAPADYDSPVPVPFLSVYGSFQLALSGPPKWVQAAVDILEKALVEIGIGAKTSSGYGRMSLEKTLSKKQRQEKELEQKLNQFQFPQQKGELNRLTKHIEELIKDFQDSAEVGRVLSQLIKQAQSLQTKQAGFIQEHMIKEIKKVEKQGKILSLHADELCKELTSPLKEGVKEANQNMEQPLLAQAMEKLAQLENPKHLGKKIMSKFWKNLNEHEKKEMAEAIKRWAEGSIDRTEVLARVHDLKGYLH